MRIERQNTPVKISKPLYLKAGYYHHNQAAGVHIAHVDETNAMGDVIIAGKIIIHADTEEEAKELQANCIRFLQKRRDREISE